MVAHRLGHRRHHVHRPDHVGAEHRAPVLVAGAGEAGQQPVVGRDLHDTVDGAEAVDRELGQRAALLGVADVGGLVRDPRSVGSSSWRDALELVGGARREHDVAAVAQHELRHLATEAGTHPGHHHRLAVEDHRRLPLSSRSTLVVAGTAPRLILAFPTCSPGLF